MWQITISKRRIVPTKNLRCSSFIKTLWKLGRNWILPKMVSDEFILTVRVPKFILTKVILSADIEKN